MEKRRKSNTYSEELNSLDKLSNHSERQDRRVMDREKKNFKCNVCGYRFSNGNDLIRHMRTHTGERPYKCHVDDCGMTFKQVSNLKLHFKFIHSDERPFKCKFPGCRHKTKIARDLIIHNKVHSDERPFACPIAGCNFITKQKRSITRHAIRVHSPVKPFACSKCDYKTSLDSYLKLHMRRHSNRRDFQCNFPQCDKSFKSSQELKSHFSNRHGERKFQCDHPGCGREYENVYSLNHHKKITHSDSEKTHTCPERSCSYRTSNASYLPRHMLIHRRKTAKIPCSKEGCDYRGKNSKAMKEHMRRHKDKTRLPCPVSGCGRYAPTKESLKEHTKLHNPSGRPFQCPLCFKYFRRLQLLQKHCAAHTNEKPFRCGHCEFAAAEKDKMKIHISSVHRNITYPFLAHPLNVRECLRCNVIMSFAEFIVHSMRHEVPVVIVERLETIWA